MVIGNNALFVYPLKRKEGKDMNKNINYNNETMEAIGRARLEVRIVSDAEAKSGVGRRVCKCPSCNGEVAHRKWVKINGCVGLSDSKRARYIGYECFLPMDYHDNAHYINVNMDGCNNTTRHRKPHVSVEFEIVSKKYGTGAMAVKSAFGFDGSEQDEAFMRVYTRLLFIGYQKSKRSNHIESDCTVSAEGHVRFRSLQGLQKFLAGCTAEELECFRDIRCGAHIHASCVWARASWCGVQVFKPVLENIEAMTSDERAKIFGSDFRGYASDNVGGHGCCINYRTRHDTIEFRLSRIHDSEQFLRVCKWWRACIACVNDNGQLVEDGIMTPARLGQKVARIDVRWEKFSKGR